MAERRGCKRIIVNSMLAASILGGTATLKYIQDNSLYGATFDFDGGQKRGILAATRVAMESRGIDNSFVPSGEFTQELYDNIRKSVFHLDVSSSVATVSGSAWAAEVDVNHGYLYLVTSNHVLFYENNIMPEEIVIRRPSTDEYTFRNIAISSNPERDLAVVRLAVGPNRISNFQAIDFLEEHETQLNEKVLTISYPGVFRNYQDEFRHFTAASVANVVESSEYHISYSAPLSNGSSGSPAIILQNNHPYVIGTTEGFGVNDFIRGNSVTASKLFGIKEMIEELRNLP